MIELEFTNAGPVTLDDREQDGPCVRIRGAEVALGRGPGGQFWLNIYDPETERGERPYVNHFVEHSRSQGGASLAALPKGSGQQMRDDEPSYLDGLEVDDRWSYDSGGDQWKCGDLVVTVAEGDATRFVFSAAERGPLFGGG